MVVFNLEVTHAARFALKTTPAFITALPSIIEKKVNKNSENIRRKYKEEKEYIAGVVYNLLLSLLYGVRGRVDRGGCEKGVQSPLSSIRAQIAVPKNVSLGIRTQLVHLV